MNVAAILKDKGRVVWTIHPQATMMEAARALTDNHIGALVAIRDDNSVAGMVSERDIVSIIARCGASCLDDQVANYMSQNVITCSESDTIDRLMEVMTERRIRHIPVTQNDRLIGIVSIGDVVKQRIAEAELHAEAMREYIATG